MTDLFDFNDNEEKAKPLAERMRASSFKDFVGQEKLVSEGSLLRRAISLDRLGSCIFWGPPGCGKTTLANVIAAQADGEFVRLNAVTAGVADVRRAVEEAREDLRLRGRRTYLLLDECHRFNKAQLDSLLPSVEQGILIFIGSTTENPYASMTPAIVSRCRVFEFEPLKESDILKALFRALKDKRKGLGNYMAEADEDAMEHIARTAAGDLRFAYNALELAVLTTPPGSDGRIRVTLRDAENSTGRRSLAFNEDQYYDMLSAFCKSLRGSDSNAALYYAMRLIEGGCDPRLILRRTVVHAAEDVGLADPNALTVATSALAAFEHLGAPEGFLPLSEAVIYVAEAPKSQSTKVAMFAAQKDAKEAPLGAVPPYLRDISYGDDKRKAERKNYLYPHDFGGWVKQQYLPDELKDRVYYTPSENGFERDVRRIRKEKGME